MSFNKIIFDFDHTLVEFGAHVDWRRAIEEIENIYLEEGITPAVLEQSKGRGFKMMRAVYDHMLGAFTPQRVREIQGRVFNALEGYELRGAAKAMPMEGAEGLLPRVVEELLQAEGKTALLGVDGKDDGEDAVAFFQVIAHVLARGAPRQVRNVNHTGEPFFDADEGAEVGDRNDLAADLRFGRIFRCGRVPRVDAKRFPADLDSLGFVIDVEDFYFDRGSGGKQLSGSYASFPG